MIKAIFFFLTFFFLASTIKFIFKFKIEIAMFIGISITTLIIALTGFFGVLSVGLYFNYIIVSFGFIYSIYYLIKNKSNFKTILKQLFTPGMIILMLAYATYFIVTRDKVLVYRDEATEWVVQIKYMFTTGINKSFGSHNNIISFFSYYMTKMIGYTEPVVFLSRWFFVWVCIIVPMADVQWKDWIKAGIYGVGAYCIVSVINATPIYYMDMPMGVIAGVLCARWSISKITLKDYVWLYAGLIILVNVKDELGLVITGLSILFLTVSNIIRYFMMEKVMRKINFTAFLPVIGIYVIYIISAVQSNMLNNIIVKMVSSFTYIKLGIVTSILVGIIVLLIAIKPWRKIELIKLVKYRTAVISLSIFGMSLLLYKIINNFYASLPLELQKTFVNAISTMYYKGYFGKPAYLLIALSIIFISLVCIVLLKRKSAISFASQGITIIIIILIYSLALAIGYVFETHDVFRESLSNIHRYYAPIYIVGAIWLLSRILDGDLEYKIKNASTIASLIIMSILIKELPYPGTVLYNNMEQYRYSVTYGLRTSLRENSELISNTIDNGNVLIIAQPENNEWDPFSAIVWIGYEILPIESNGIILTEDTRKMFDGKYSVTFSQNELKNFIINNNYSYVYVYSADEYFIDEFSELFEKCDILYKNVLYKVTPDEEYFLSFLANEQ